MRMRIDTNITAIYVFFLLIVLLFSNCRIEQATFIPSFYLSDDSIKFQIGAIANGSQVEITGQEIQTSYSNVKIIAIHLVLNDTLSSLDSSELQTKGLQIARYLKTQIKEPGKNLGIHVMFFPSQSKNPIGDFAILLEEL